MSPTLPFWVGALILILPATIMILAVINALPPWFGSLVFLILFGLPLPAAAWTIGNGIQALRDRPSGQADAPDRLRSWWTAASALASILLALLVMAGAILLLAWFAIRQFTASP
ncbi:hypothetical protein AB1L88_18005 [Tautonia sp. JC769]|uniref:hypothetical protein n=1 Tax=Tautonia sp. JC769 TaxID=3232135 RepID=UPI003457F480